MTFSRVRRSIGGLRSSAPVAGPRFRRLPVPSAAHSGTDALPCPCGGACPKCREKSGAHAPASRSSAALLHPSAAGSEYINPAALGPGQPLSTTQRAAFEPRLGASLGKVRLHTGPQADSASRALGARAYTIGADIVLSGREVGLDTQGGRYLLAHELTHVVQQSAGSPASSGAQGAHQIRKVLSRSHPSETEARHAADTVTAGGTFHPRQKVGPAIQRDEPDSPPSTLDWRYRALHPWTSQGEFQLQLDPELQSAMFRLFLRNWFNSEIGGASGASLPEPGVPSPEGSATPSAPTATAPASPTEPETDTGSGPPLPERWVAPPDYLTPDVLGGPDFSSFFGAYNLRGVPLSGRAGDVDIMMQLYRDRLALVQSLPDLRSMAPGFIRPLIPGTWRSDLANTLTTLTINNALRHDYPTVLEAADQSWQIMTGATTTYFPSLPVPFVSGWWERFSGGSIRPPSRPSP